MRDTEFGVLTIRNNHMVRAKITRTYGPIHFEDLDPHRFEDLVRELIYDFRDWQTIESTGRSGSDDGFDIRAYEKVPEIASQEGDEDEQEVHPMEGNLWMIQCKREKELSPKRITAIVNESVAIKNPPYGFILVAPTNFSKKSFDTFRVELKDRGVMEFYLWGKAELEDMLHFPKNDRILFTFFGISLVSRRRSRATEIRTVVSNKNKLLRTLGESLSGFQSILIRDLKDTKYPYKKEYKDFETRPRWREYLASEYHPLGLIVKIAEHYAFADQKKKEFDFTKETDLIQRRSETHRITEEKRKRDERVKNFSEFLPRRHQARLARYGLVKFDEMAVIDDKGDVVYNYPHIFVDFRGNSGPFYGFWNYLEINGEEIEIDEFKKVSVFPEKFPEPRIGKIHSNKPLVWNDPTLERFKKEYDRFHTFYDADGRFDYLKVGDIVPVENSKEYGEQPSHIQITYKYAVKVKDYLDEKNNCLA